MIKAMILINYIKRICTVLTRDVEAVNFRAASTASASASASIL